MSSPDSPSLKMLTSALRIPAAGADETAFLIDEQVTAIGALPG